MAPFGRPKRDELEKLKEFAGKHQGVEGYLEPRTATFDQSLLLVARDGEWLRATVADRKRAESFCKKLAIPFYDAQIVGYPERMRGRKKTKPPPPAPTPAELEAWFKAESAREGD
ncbi:MAG: hypothetical protein NVSMB32_17760 [Actinomycetota bacterium]